LLTDRKTDKQKMAKNITSLAEVIIYLLVESAEEKHNTHSKTKQVTIDKETERE